VSALQNIVTVLPRPPGAARVGKCYNNVKEMIRQSGGEMCYGWALTDFGPHRCNGHHDPLPLYRRWLNHVVWRDATDQLWEASPNAVIGDYAEGQFMPTEFLPDPGATFEIISDEEWFPRHSRYVPVRPEGMAVVELLTNAQHAVRESRTFWLQRALAALEPAGFRPREWKVETIGERTGSIWLIAE
jgi:hypothetical protein